MRATAKKGEIEVTLEGQPYELALALRALFPEIKQAKLESNGKHKNSVPSIEAIQRKASNAVTDKFPSVSEFIVELKKKPQLLKAPLKEILETMKRENPDNSKEFSRVFMRLRRAKHIVEGGQQTISQ